MLDNLPMLNDLPADVRDGLIRILLVILTIAIIWLLRRVFTWILIKPLRHLIGRTGNTYDDRLVEAIIPPMRWFIIAIGILISAQILQITGGLLTFIENVGRSLIIVAILMLVFRVIDLLMPSAPMLARITGIKLEDRLLPFIRTAVKVVVIALGMVITLQEWGYDVSGLVAGLGLGGLAFSLAAQDTVSNLFGFMALVSDRPFNVGEYIVTPDVQGIVESVGIRSTSVRQLDQAVVYVPNHKLANSAILNWSRLQKRRVDYVLGVTYDSTSGEIRVLLHRIREMLKQQETVDPDTVTVYFVNFGDSSLDIMVRCYVLISDWGEFTAEKERLNLLVMDIVAELGMSVAFPSISLYVENISEFPGARPVEEAQPKLSARENALMTGTYEKVEQAPPEKPDENVTGQQDEPEDDD